MQDWPALAMADQMVASTARSKFASAATITGSFPPHSRTTGVILIAQAAATNLAVFVEPVKDNLSISLVHKALPVSAKPVIVVKMSAKGATVLKLSSSHTPTPGVYSLGLNTTVLPAAKAYAIDPTGVKIG